MNRFENQKERKIQKKTHQRIHR